MSEVLGQPVRYERTPAGEYKNNFLRLGFSEPIAQGMLDMAMAKDEGLDNGITRTPEFSTPTTFRQWCTDVLKPASTPEVTRAALRNRQICTRRPRIIRSPVAILIGGSRSR